MKFGKIGLTAVQRWYPKPPAAAGTPFFVGQPPPKAWDYWPGDEAKRQPVEFFRLYMAQTKLAPWVATLADNRQQYGSEEFRRVSEDGWSVFRPYWTPPSVVGPPFFVGQPAPKQWDYWQQDEARRDPGVSRLFFPQTKLTPQVAFQAETRQQLDAEGFRRVSDNGWDLFRFYWTPPSPGPSPPTGNPRLWYVYSHGIQTKIVFISGDQDN